MPVAVEHGHDRGLAGSAGNLERLGTGGDPERHCGMAKIMRAGRRQPGPALTAGCQAPERRAMRSPATFPGEHELVGSVEPMVPGLRRQPSASAPFGGPPASSVARCAADRRPW